MRILFVADGRSPTALQWMEHFVRSGHEVHLTSTFFCEPKLKLASLHLVPVAFSGSSTAAGKGSILPVGLRTRVRNWLGPFTISAAARQVQAILDEISPALVHAMRIPYEGMLTAAANPKAPLLISVWGNDFTLHARSNPFMAAATRRTMQRANALHTDNQRDLRLANRWGFAKAKPSIVLPGNGGVRREIFYPPEKKPAVPKIVNPRGIRAYVRNDVFFKAVELAIKKIPTLSIDCPDMEGQPEAERLVQRLNLKSNVNLLPKLSPQELAENYRAAQVMVSPSTHDGTPNSLLEAMACGCLPVCGDLESIREWIEPEENGLLIDPKNPHELAEAILRAIKDSSLREQAIRINQRLISEKGDYVKNMKLAEHFYMTLAN